MTRRAPKTIRAALLRESRGLAALEFALMLPLLVVLLIGMIDVGMAMNAHLRMMSAMAAAAQYAQRHGSELSKETYPSFVVAVQNVAQAAYSGAGVMTTTIEVNGAKDMSAIGANYCAVGRPVTYRPVSTNTACDSNLPAGGFVTIKVAVSQATALPLPEVFGEALRLSDSVTVRVA